VPSIELTAMLAVAMLAVAMQAAAIDLRSYRREASILACPNRTFPHRCDRPASLMEVVTTTPMEAAWIGAKPVETVSTEAPSIAVKPVAATSLVVAWFGVALFAEASPGVQPCRQAAPDWACPSRTSQRRGDNRSATIAVRPSRTPRQRRGDSRAMVSA
jgi:hypothetical protein